MAEIRDVYSIEFDSAAFEAQIQSAISQIDQLNSTLEDSTDATSGLESATSNLNSILKTEASGIDQLNAKRNVLVGTQKNLNKESAAYNQIGGEINNTNKQIATTTAQTTTKSKGLFSTFLRGARSLNTVRRSVSLLNVAFRTIAGVSLFGLLIQGAQLLASALGFLNGKSNEARDGLERLNDPTLGLNERRVVIEQEIAAIERLAGANGRLSKQQRKQRDELVQKYKETSDEIEKIETDRLNKIFEIEQKVQRLRIQNLDDASRATAEAELDRQKIFKSTTDQFVELQKEQQEVLREEARLRSSGKSIEADVALSRAENIARQIDALLELQAEEEKATREQKARKLQEIADNKILEGSIQDLRKEISGLREDQERRTLAGDSEALVAIEKQIDALDKQLKAAESALNDFRNQAAARERIEKLTTDLIENETAKRIENLRRAANTEIENVIGSEEQKAEQRRLISERLTRDIEALLAERTEKENDAIRKAADETRETLRQANEQLISDAQLESERLLSVRLQEIERRRNAELQSVANTITDAEQRNQAVEDVNKRFDSERVRAERETQSEILRIQIAAVQARIETNERAGESVTEERAELEKLKLELVELGRIDPTIDIIVNDEDAKQKLSETIAEIADTVEQISNELLGSVGEFLATQTAALDASVQRSRDALNRIRQDSENFNARQLELEKQRLERLEQQRARAAEREKAIALTQLTVNSLVAVSKAAAEGGILAPFTIASTIIALIAGFASARSASENAFFEGTEFVDPHGKYPAGRDMVPARLHRGERVITTKTNKEYWNTLSAIHNGTVPSDVLNDFVSGYLRDGMSPNAMTQLSPNIVLVNTGSNSGGVEKRLERIENVLSDLPKYMPRTTIKGDMGGMIRVVEKRQARANFNDNRAK
jgi:hypothetical protein